MDSGWTRGGAGVQAAGALWLVETTRDSLMSDLVHLDGDTVVLLLTLMVTFGVCAWSRCAHGEEPASGGL